MIYILLKYYDSKINFGSLNFSLFLLLCYHDLGSARDENPQLVDLVLAAHDYDISSYVGVELGNCFGNNKSYAPCLLISCLRFELFSWPGRYGSEKWIKRILVLKRGGEIGIFFDASFAKYGSRNSKPVSW